MEAKETQNKLEIHHVAKRLPYGLKAEMLNYKSDYVGQRYDTLVGVHQWDKNSQYWSALTIHGSKPNLQDIKPLLFPLGSLTETIQIKGKEFIPIIEILKKASLFDLSDCTFDVYEVDNSIYVNAENKDRTIDSLCYDFNIFYSMDNDLGYNPTNPQSELQDLLLEFHFDLPHENLIEKGLAVSVFDLDKNPYA